MKKLIFFTLILLANNTFTAVRTKKVIKEAIIDINAGRQEVEATNDEQCCTCTVGCCIKSAFLACGLCLMLQAELHLNSLDRNEEAARIRIREIDNRNNTHLKTD